MENLGSSELDPLNAEVPIGLSDRGWMETFGCQWPDADSEQGWLTNINLAVETGNSKLTLHSNDTTGQYEMSRIIGARRRFFTMLPDSIGPISAWNAMNNSSPETLVVPSHFIDTQRALFSMGLNGCEVITSRPSMIRSSSVRIRSWAAGLDAAGLDSTRLAHINPQLIFKSADSIIQRTDEVCAFIRSTGADNPAEITHELIHGINSVLTASSKKMAVLSAVLRTTLPDYKITPEDIRPLGSLYIIPIEATVVSAIRHREGLSSLRGLHGQAEFIRRQCREGLRSKKELLGIIATAGLDDPIAKVYLHAYSVEDVETLKADYAADLEMQQYVNERSHPLMWAGPELLGHPSMTAFRAFKEAIGDVKELGDQDFMELSETIANGHTAEVELRYADVRDDQELLDSYVLDIELAMQARVALIVQCLSLVGEIVDSCKRLADPGDMVGIGNLALNRHVMESSLPKNSVQIKRSIIAAIMRALTGYYPRYDGRSLHDLEVAWEAEDRAAQARVSSGSDS